MVNLLPSRRGLVRVLRTTLRHPANRSRKIEALLRVLRFQIWGRLLSREVVVPYGHHSRFIAHLDAGPSRRAAYAPVPDWLEMGVWQTHLRPGDLFVDVGASVGLYTVLAAELGCEVIAVEPLEASRAQLTANLSLNGYTSCVVVPAALGANTGYGTVAGPDWSRQHLVRYDQDSESSRAGEAVPVMTLDQVLGTRIAAGVKIDVEGAERMVMQGAEQALREKRIRLLQLEWNAASIQNCGEGREALASHLKGFGYELFRPTSRGVLEPITGHGLGRDVFARPRSD